MNIKSKTQLCITLLLFFVFGQLLAQTKEPESKVDSILNQPINLKTSNIKIQIDDIPEETDLQSTTQLQIDFTSNYIWRDFIYGFVAAQPSADHTFGKTGFSLNVWSSFGLDFNTVNLEVIPSLTYSFTAGKKLDLALGIIYYTAPQYTATEIYIYSGISSFPLAPSLEVYYDLNEVFYMSLSLGQTLYDLAKNQIDLNASIGYRALSNLNDNGLRDLNFGISMPFESKYITYTVFSRLTYIPDLNITQIQGGISVLFK